MAVTKPLKTLDQHNHEVFSSYVRDYTDKTIPNGILCPGCKAAELVDSDPTCTLTTSPPQKRTKCLDCGYEGLRFVWG